MDQAEQKLYMKSLEEQLELRTRQLKQAVASWEDLLHLVGDAAPALRNVDDPAVKKLLERVPVGGPVSVPTSLFGGKPGEPVLAPI